MKTQTIEIIIYEPGDKVVFGNFDKHIEGPEYYPNIGTIGEVVKTENNGFILVQWIKGSTSRNDKWYCMDSDIRPFKE